MQEERKLKVLGPNQEPDPDLNVTLPDSRDPTIFGKVSISSATSPHRPSETGTQTKEGKQISRLHIRAEWWDPVVV